MVRQAWCCLREVPYCFWRSSVKFWGYTAKQINRIGRSRTTTPVWIHQWLLNAAKTWSSIEGVPYCFSSSCVKFQGHTGYKTSSILIQIGRFWNVTPVWIHWRLWNSIEEVPYCFFKVICQIPTSHGKISPILPRIEGSEMYHQFKFTDDFEMMHKA